MPQSEREKYLKFHASPIAIKRRSARNKARRLAKKKYGEKAIKGKDIDHVHTNPGGELNSDITNIRISSVKRNRGRNSNSWRKTKKRNS